MHDLLLQDATSDEIRELFSQFGTVKSGNGAITLKHNGNNNSFAYVDFMDVASAQACVDAKDVMLKDNIVGPSCTSNCSLSEWLQSSYKVYLLSTPAVMLSASHKYPVCETPVPPS